MILFFGGGDPNYLRFSVGIEIDLIFVRGIEIGFVFACGRK